MKFIYKLFLTGNASMLLITVFLIKEQYRPNILIVIPDFIWYLFYIAIPLLFSFICLWLIRFLKRDDLEDGIIDVEEANYTYLSSYLGYFFVALSINNVTTLFFVYALVFLFTFYSQTLYFNPLFLIYNYRFYYLTTEKRKKIFMITRQKITTIDNLKFDNLFRINNFTFIDKER